MPFNASFYLTDMHILDLICVLLYRLLCSEYIEGENLNLKYQTSFWDIVFFLLRINSIRAIEIKLLLVQIRFSLDRVTFESI